jgi:WD40 repeat protein
VAKCKVDFSIKQKTGYVKGFEFYGQGDKIIVGYKKGYVVVWDISKILEPGIENFVSYGHEIDDFMVSPSSKHAIIVCRKQKTVKCLDILNNFALVSENKLESLKEYKYNTSCSEDCRYFAFITKNHVHVMDLKAKDHRSFKTNFELSCISMKPDGEYLVVGDVVGKIHYYYSVFSEKGLTISTRHWHANKVNSLHFSKDGAFLMSGGKEAVIVLWHQTTQQNSFISRMGNQIVNINSSDDGSLIVVSMRDNSIKIVKSQNYETVQQIKGLVMDPNYTRFVQKSKV